MATVADPPAADAACSPEAAPPAGDALRVRSQALVTLAMLSVAAGVIHAVAMVDHFDHYWLYGVFFLVITYAQALWGIWVYRHPQSRRVLAAGAAGNLAIVAVWIVSRTVGVPVGPDTWSPERIGAMDVVATVDQLALAAIALSLVAPASRLGASFARAATDHTMRLGVMLCSASLFSILLGSHQH